MLIDKAIDYVGGIPDHFFVNASKFFRTRCSKDYDSYMKSMAFYRSSSHSLFYLPKLAPEVNLRTKSIFHGGHHLKYEFFSTYVPQNPLVENEFQTLIKNRTCPIHLWQHKETSKPPLVLCLHGFMLGDPRTSEKMFSIEKLFKKGVDVALYTLPHHGQRTSHFLNQRMLNPDNMPLTLESFAQAQHDLHSTILSLRVLGYKKIGLIGASLGGLTSILYVSLTDQMDFMFSVVPSVDLGDVLRPSTSCFSFPINEEMKEESLALLKLITPENYKPKLAIEKMATVFHSGDKVNSAERTRSWIKTWNISNVVEVRGGHWLYLNRKIRGKTWYNWLEKHGFI